MQNKELLTTFVRLAGNAETAYEAAEFWASNHHLISPLVPRADKFLDAESHEALLHHLMRRTFTIWPAPKQHFERIVSAYRAILPIIDDPQKNRLRRHCGLFLFGFDDAGALSGGPTLTAQDYEAYRKFLTYAASFTNIPAQWKKSGKFGEFSGLAPRMLETLRQLGYNHDRFYPGNPTLYDRTDLVFWAMALVVAMTPGLGGELLADLLDENLALPCRDAQLATLSRLVDAIRPSVAADEVQFHALADQLAARIHGEALQTESTALNARLDWRFKDNENWFVTINVPDASHGLWFQQPGVKIEIRRGPQYVWSVLVVDGARRSFSESVAGVTQNDADIAPLGAGNLHRLPDWLRETTRAFGMTLAYDKARISCGRNRHAVKQATAWLSGEA